MGEADMLETQAHGCGGRRRLSGRRRAASGVSGPGIRRGPRPRPRLHARVALARPARGSAHRIPARAAARTARCGNPAVPTSAGSRSATASRAMATVGEELQHQRGQEGDAQHRHRLACDRPRPAARPAATLAARGANRRRSVQALDGVEQHGRRAAAAAPIAGRLACSAARPAEHAEQQRRAGRARRTPARPRQSANATPSSTSNGSAGASARGGR